MPEVSLIQAAMLKRLQRQAAAQHQEGSGTEAFVSSKSNTITPEQALNDSFFKGIVVDE